MEDNSSIRSHVSIGTNNFERAVAFYDKILPTLGRKRIMEHPGAVAYGKQYPEFWVQTPIDGQPASVGNGTHIGFVASTKEAVHAFHKLYRGVDDGGPGPSSAYGEPYYGCFVRDPDGQKVEASFWDMELIQSSSWTS